MHIAWWILRQRDVFISRLLDERKLPLGQQDEYVVQLRAVLRTFEKHDPKVRWICLRQKDVSEYDHFRSKIHRYI